MKDNKREKKLLINSILYFFGSLGKGIASIIIVFIGSFFIKPSEMGIYDLVVSTVALLQPVIIFQLNDGIYRWLLDENIRKEDTIRCGYKIIIRNMIVANILMAFILPLLSVQYKVLICILININCLYPVFQQITRGLKSHKIFAISGIVNATLILGISYGLLKMANFGIASFYVAQIVANSVSIVFLIVTQEIPIDFWKSVDEKIYDEISMPMQKYSILLVPNSINQWIMKALDKYCILFFLSSYFNGIYTVAHRLPDMVIMVNNMFYSAWVEQSIVEYKSKDRDKYFSKIFNSYSSALFSVVLFIIPTTKYVLKWVSGAEYSKAFVYVPFLYIAVAFNGLSSFIGTGYLGTRKTEGIMWTSLSGALVNTVINIVFMKKFGLQIAGISSICAYVTMFVSRIIQTKKFFTLSINYKALVGLSSVAFVYAILVQRDNFYLDIMMASIAVVIIFLFNYKLIFGVLDLAMQKVKHLLYKNG